MHVNVKDSNVDAETLVVMLDELASSGALQEAEEIFEVVVDAKTGREMDAD